MYKDKKNLEDAVQNLHTALKELKDELENKELGKKRVALIFHSANPGKQVEDVDPHTSYGIGIVDMT